MTEIFDANRNYLPGLEELFDRGDHGKHDSNIRIRAGAKDGLDLLGEDVLVLQRKANTPHAHARVLFAGVVIIAQHLVAADIERAEGDGFALHAFDNSPVSNVPVSYTHLTLPTS